MIKSFRHKGIEQFFHTKSLKGIQPQHAKKLSLQLGVLDVRLTLEEMGLPGWQLHRLKGNLKDPFKLEDHDVLLVDYQDYHSENTMPMFDPPYPGLLIEDIKGDRTITELAKHLKVTRAALSRTINGKAAISAEMALRLEAAFGAKADLWLGMQSARDVWVASQKKRVTGKRLIFEEAA